MTSTYVSKRPEDFALAEVAALPNSAAIEATSISNLVTEMTKMTNLELAGSGMFRLFVAFNRVLEAGCHKHSHVMPGT